MDLCIQYKEQDPTTFFAHFPYKVEEEYFTPFQKLANFAKEEIWDFETGPEEERTNDFFILRKYLNSTFRRLWDENKIVYYTNNGYNYACFNTGLQTQHEEDIFANFHENRFGKNQWIFSNFRTMSSLTRCIPPENLPQLASYWTDPSDLIFDLSYEIIIHWEHIFEMRSERFPICLQQNLMFTNHQVFQGAVLAAKERVRRNYKTVVPSWFYSAKRIQLLLPLYFTNNFVPDVALVLDKESSTRTYHGQTILPIHNAYINARTVCRLDAGWLRP